MSVRGTSRNPRRPVRGYIPRGYPLPTSGGFNETFVATIDDASRTVAFHSALDAICSLVSELDMQFWNGPPSDQDRQRVDQPPWYDNLAGDGFDINDWNYQALVSLVARGNLFGRVLDTTSGGTTVTQCDILSPELVRPPAGIRPTDVTLPPGADWIVDGAPDPRVRHWRAAPRPGLLMGPSIIETHATSIRMPQVAAAFGSRWFDDGGHPSSVLLNDYLDANSINSASAQVLKEEFIASTRGRREPLVLGRGWKYQAVSVTAEESQFLATLGYGQAEVAKMFGPGVAEILGYSNQEGGGLTYANLDSRTAHLLIFSVGKWISRLERIHRAFTPVRVWPQFDRSKIQDATPGELAKTLDVLLGCRAITPNEARKRLGLAPAVWGDEPNPIAGANVQNSNEDNIPIGEPVPTKKGTK